jgi:hypothetical protein
MHPIVLLKETPVSSLVGRAPKALLRPIKGVECARFGRRVVVVNHRSIPVSIAELKAVSCTALNPTAPGWIAAHSAVMLELGE